jgi:hypothetical protein
MTTPSRVLRIIQLRNLFMGHVRAEELMIAITKAFQGDSADNPTRGLCMRGQYFSKIDNAECADIVFAHTELAIRFLRVDMVLQRDFLVCVLQMLYEVEEFCIQMPWGRNSRMRLIGVRGTRGLTQQHIQEIEFDLL